jgi:hypothetical protein
LPFCPDFAATGGEIWAEASFEVTIFLAEKLVQPSDKPTGVKSSQSNYIEEVSASNFQFKSHLLAFRLACRAETPAYDRLKRSRQTEYYATRMQRLLRT